MPGLRAGTPTARAVCRAIQLPMWMLLLPWRGVGAARRSAMKQGAKLSLWEGFFLLLFRPGWPALTMSAAHIQLCTGGRSVQYCSRSFFRGVCMRVHSCIRKKVGGGGEVWLLE